MTIFMECPYNHCKARAQVQYSDGIGEELQTDKDKALAELRKRVAGLLKHAHRKGEHQRGR